MFILSHVFRSSVLCSVYVCVWLCVVGLCLISAVVGRLRCFELYNVNFLLLICSGTKESKILTLPLRPPLSTPYSETLSEDKDFSNRHLAAVVASKVFYHLEELDDALKYALDAGSLFDVQDESQYVETLIAKCIDDYIRLRVEADEGKDDVVIDDRLSDIVERMFDRCESDGKWYQALGIAIESRRLDKLEHIITASGSVADMLKYCYDISRRMVVSRDFRKRLLNVLVKMYSGLEQPDYISMCQCLLFLNDAASVAASLAKLIGDESSSESVLTAYQVAFELNENQNHPFLMRVRKALPALPTNEDGSANEESELYQRGKKLRSILSGEVSTDLYLHFLYNQNKTDLNVINLLKDKLDTRNSVTHTATVIANGFMHAGTTVDVFLADNLEWLGHANNWSKFSATASIGVIQKGQVNKSKEILQPYLPTVGSSGSPYQEGGALYAMGLIHALHGDSQIDYLVEQLLNAGNNEIIQHGACLGLGLAAMASGNPLVFDHLKNVLYSDSAVAGEAAGIAMGLVNLGTGNGDALADMIAYAHDTKHEKIIRGLALGVALHVYAREEDADVVIEQMLTDKDAIIRYGGMHAIALAYAGTANNRAIKKLLHVGVSDVSDEVRRAAVTGLGFVLCNEPEQVPRIVQLLSESYNAHVRYGACLAVGISCAGTGLKSAIDLIEPMMKDRVDFVRQGAMIAMSMVLLQQNKTAQPKVQVVRDYFDEIIARKGDTVSKFGAILGTGIMNAGGRNVSIQLLSPAGHKRMASIVGMSLFTQFWNWYPMTHFLSLSFTPTALIGLNEKLEIPANYEVVCNAKPSQFAFPPDIETKKEEKKGPLKKAVLSVTAKKARKDKKTAVDADGDVEMKDATTAGGDTADDESKKKEEEKKEAEKKKKVEEPSSFSVSNPSRVTPQQHGFISEVNGRYHPVTQQARGTGIVLLVDTKPDEEESIYQPKAPKIGVPGVSADEPEPPEPFQFLR